MGGCLHCDEANNDEQNTIQLFLMEWPPALRKISRYGYSKLMCWLHNVFECF